MELGTHSRNIKREHSQNSIQVSRSPVLELHEFSSKKTSFKKRSSYKGSMNDVPDGSEPGNNKSAEAVLKPGKNSSLWTSLGISTENMKVQFDYWLVLCIVGLVCFGLVMVFSASTMAVANDPSYYFRRHLLWVAIGIIAMVTVMRIDYHQWTRFSVILMVVSLGLMIAVLRVGETINGAQRWISLGSFASFQPSEIAKLALALYIADWLSKKGSQVQSFLYGFVPFALLTGFVLSLVLLQNDMGTALILAGIALTMFATAGANLLQLVPSVLIGIGCAFSLIFNTFRKARIVAFTNPLQDCSNATHHICQALYALGSGGWFGLGLGDSRQKAGWLPFPWTDSIFAVVGEELGFIGCIAVIGLFVFLAYRGFSVARKSADMYGALLATGITSWLIIQALVNIGSITDTIPFTGVPLPFISYGGSSFVASLLAVGILLNISRQSSHIQVQENEQI